MIRVCGSRRTTLLAMVAVWKMLAVWPWLAPGAAADEGPTERPQRPPASGVRSEPELCRRILADSDAPPLEALRQAENDRWRAARTASRQGRKHLRRTLGGGPSLAARGTTAEIADHQSRYHRAVAEARVICGCREARKDPLREDCDAAFRALQARPGFAPPQP
ncbi:MAG: hypothetical protein ACQGVK_21035 [Myxococcota bacterium]